MLVVWHFVKNFLTLTLDNFYSKIRSLLHCHRSMRIIYKHWRCFKSTYAAAYESFNEKQLLNLSSCWQVLVHLKIMALRAYDSHAGRHLLSSGFHSRQIKQAIMVVSENSLQKKPTPYKKRDVLCSTVLRLEFKLYADLDEEGKYVKNVGLLIT